MIASYPQCKRNQDAGAASLDDVLGVVEFEIVIKDNLGGLLYSIEAVVTQQQNVQLQVSSLFLGLDV